MECKYGTLIWVHVIFSVILKSDIAITHRLRNEHFTEQVDSVSLKDSVSKNNLWMTEREIRFKHMNSHLNEYGNLSDFKKQFPNITSNDRFCSLDDYIDEADVSSVNVFVDISKIGTETVHLLKPKGFNISIKGK